MYQAVTQPVGSCLSQLPCQTLKIYPANFWWGKEVWSVRLITWQDDFGLWFFSQNTICWLTVALSWHIRAWSMRICKLLYPFDNGRYRFEFVKLQRCVLCPCVYRCGCLHGLGSNIMCSKERTESKTPSPELGLALLGSCRRLKAFRKTPHVIL